MEQTDSTNSASGKGFDQTTSIALLTVLFLTLLVYSPVCQLQFSSVDDGPNVFANPYLQNPAAQNLSFFWTHTYYGLYMPITDCIWALCARISPLAAPTPLPLSQLTSTLNPSVFHTLNLVFHACNACLVFAILRRLRFRSWPCAGGALLFALHPAQVESVAWVTGFNNICSGFFCLNALYFYLLSIPPPTPIPRVEDQAEEPARMLSFKHRWMFLCLATLCFLCALLSKPTATVLPLFVAILEAVAFRRPLRCWIGLVVFWCVPAFACATLSHFGTQENNALVWSPVWGRLFVAGDALFFYLFKLALPLRLTFDYGRPPRVVLHSWWGFVDWLIPVALAVGLWRMRSKHVSAQKGTSLWLWFWVAFLLFAAGLVGVLGLVPFYSQATSTVSDRYLYLSLLGPAIAVAAALSRIDIRFARGAGVLATFVLAALASRSVVQEFVWSNPYSLTANMLKESPNSALANHLYGGILSSQGNYAAALPYLFRSKRLQSMEMPANDQEIAVTLIHLGRYAEAAAPLEDAITVESYRSEHWVLLWYVLSRMQHLDGAAVFMQNRLRTNPRDGKAEFTLGVIRMQRENALAALPELEAGARDAPDFVELQSDLGAVLELLKRLPQAEAQYKYVLQLDPDNKDARAALVHLHAQETGIAH